MLRSREEPVGLLLAAIRRRLRQVVQAHAAGHRLSPQQFWALVGIQEGAPISLGKLSERLRIDQPAASRVVATLTRRGLVRMAADPRDRRRLVIETTAPGAELASRVRPIARDVRGAIVGGFSPAELDTLQEFLRRILDNLDRLESHVARRPPRPAPAREVRT